MRRGLVLAVVAAVALVVAAAALGYTYADKARRVSMRPGDTATFRGVECMASRKSAAFLCVKAGGDGYAVAFGRYAIVVIDANGDSVFEDTQP